MENSNGPMKLVRSGAARRKLLTRYLIGQRLSDYQIEKIIRAFTDGIVATDLAKSEEAKRLGRVSSKTIFRIYNLLRQRLLELGVFPDPSRYLEFWRNDETGAITFPFSETANEIGEMVHRLQGASDETMKAHVAEILFRAENRDLPSGAFFLLIQQAVKITSPLNQPAQNMDVWAEYASIFVYERNVRVLRKRMPSNPDAHRKMIDTYQEMIEERLQNIRRLMRARDSRARFRAITGGKNALS